MHILIVEDEFSIAVDIEYHCRSILGTRLKTISRRATLESAAAYLGRYAVDLMLLDLTLSDRNGIELLRTAPVEIQTIIVSAGTDQVAEAYRLGALDFLTKPFREEQLRKAFERHSRWKQGNSNDAVNLHLRRHGRLETLDTSTILYFRTCAGSVEFSLISGGREVFDLPRACLERSLPNNFYRVDHSHTVNLWFLEACLPIYSRETRITFRNGETLPVRADCYKRLYEQLKQYYNPADSCRSC